MANRKRKPPKSRRSTKKKPTKPRRSTKTTQVTGEDIDKTYEDLVNLTPLERKVEEGTEQDMEDYSNTLINCHYVESSPFDPDVDVDREPENRKKMYEVPPKNRSPDGGGSSSTGQDEQQKEGIE